ncbi:MAG TPA: hypothetical protein VNZ61_04710 [Roseomonas sp.]|nr:hypothetical protein [Roseomonas sp.]
MRETIRLRLAGDAIVGEAAAEARGIAFGREPGCERWAIDQVVRDLLTEIDALLPDPAPIKADGRQYRPPGVSERAGALDFAMHFDERGKPRQTNWQGTATKIAAASLVAMLRRQPCSFSGDVPCAPYHRRGTAREAGLKLRRGINVPAAGGRQNYGNRRAAHPNVR